MKIALILLIALSTPAFADPQIARSNLHFWVGERAGGNEIVSGGGCKQSIESRTTVPVTYNANYVCTFHMGRGMAAYRIVGLLYPDGSPIMGKIAKFDGATTGKPCMVIPQAGPRETASTNDWYAEAWYWTETRPGNPDPFVNLTVSLECKDAITP